MKIIQGGADNTKVPGDTALITEEDVWAAKKKMLDAMERNAARIKERMVGQSFTIRELSSVTGRRPDVCMGMIEQLSNFFLVERKKTGEHLEFRINLDPIWRIEQIKEFGMMRLKEAKSEQEFYREMIEIISVANQTLSDDDSTKDQEKTQDIKDKASDESGSGVETTSHKTT